MAATVYVTEPLPVPEAGLKVSQVSGEVAVQPQVAGAVTLTVPVAPAEAAEIGPLELSEMVQGPVELGSTARVRLRASPKEPTPRTWDRPAAR